MSGENNYTTEQLAAEFASRAVIRATLAEVILAEVPAGGLVTELGSGLGFNLDQLRDRYRVLGVEGLSGAVEAARKRGIETLHCDLEQALPLEQETSDAVLCLDVLEHLLDPLSCLREARRILKPGGLLVCNVPNHFTASSRIRILRGAGIDAPGFFPDSPAWRYPHVRFFQHQSFLALATAGGFEIVKDLSSRFTAVPVLRKSGAFSTLCTAISRRWPNAFAGGFFLVLRPRDPGPG